MSYADGTYSAERMPPTPSMDSWVRETSSLSSEPTILVVDPATRKLCVPCSAIAQTQALLRTDRVPSICMLYLQGRCRQGMHCHQLHADPSVISMLRSELSTRTSCCPEHGEDVTQPNLTRIAPDVEALTVEGLRIPAARVATTNGICRLAHDRSASRQERQPGEIAVIRGQICRLHIQGRCRYAEDCNFIHLCRSLCDGEDVELAKMLTSMVAHSAARGGRPGRMMGTPSSAFIPPMPPSPPYACSPHTPLVSGEGFGCLDHNEDSHGTTPPSTPANEGASPLATPTHGMWRHEPYTWAGVSPVK